MDENRHTDNSGVDEEMERLEQAIEHGEYSFPSAEEIRAFDNAVREMLIDLAQCQQRAVPGEGQSNDEEEM